MQKQNVGRTYGPTPVRSFGGLAQELARTLGVADESVTAQGLLPAGVVAVCGGQDLFAQMFNDLTDDGIGNSARRLAAGTTYFYDGEFQPDRTYWATGEILSVEDREGRTGRYQYGTLETRYAAEEGAAPVLRVQTVFAERQGPPSDRKRPEAAQKTTQSSHFAAWDVRPYTNGSILTYVLLVDDRNRNHRDDEYARSNGFPCRIAQGGMANNLLGEYVSRNIGTANVEAVTFRLTQPIYPLQTLRIEGHVVSEPDSSDRTFLASLLADGNVAATATARLRPASR
jgi:hydroxyacyl-ACP dehydratase HTD2-like protein with hotdog domain